MAYFRKLNRAGVDASARTVLGVNHGWEIFALDLVSHSEGKKWRIVTFGVF